MVHVVGVETSEMSESSAQCKLFYDDGWNARVRGEPFDARSTRDWQDGWKDCDEAPPEDRVAVS